MSSTTSSGKTDVALIHEILEGHRDAYAELVRRYERLVHAAVWAIVRDHHSAQDVTQETFLKAYRQLGSLRKPGTFGAWLVTIGRRTATDFVRGRRQPVSVPELPEIPLLEPVGEEDAVAVLNALAQLPYHEQQVILLRYFEDLPVATIADQLGIPVGTITKQISRGLASLREQLKETR